MGEMMNSKSAMSSDFKAYVDRYHQLRAHASSAVTCFCLPAITEMAAMLDAISSTYEKTVKEEEETAEAHTKGASSEHIFEQGAYGRLLDSAWAGLANVAERAVSRIIGSDKGVIFPHHVSAIVKLNSKDDDRAVHVKVYDSVGQWGRDRSGETFSIDSPQTAHEVGAVDAVDPALLGLQSSVLERCFRLGGMQECSGEAVALEDLVGIHQAKLASLLGMQSLIGSRSRSIKALSVLCASVQDAHGNTVAVVRLVYQINADTEEGRMKKERGVGEGKAMHDPSPTYTRVYTTGGIGGVGGVEESFLSSGSDPLQSFSIGLLDPVLQMIGSLGGSMIQVRRYTVCY